VESHGDHRLAMSLAVAALVAGGETAIGDAGSVSISYPAFWEHLEALTGAADAQSKRRPTLDR